MSKLVCKDCGFVGTGTTITKGSIFIELVLWCFLIVPGLIYSIWRHTTRHKGCPKCGSAHLIPADSPIGQRFISENSLAKR